MMAETNNPVQIIKFESGYADVAFDDSGIGNKGKRIGTFVGLANRVGTIIGEHQGDPIAKLKPREGLRGKLAQLFLEPSAIVVLPGQSQYEIIAEQAE